MVKCVEGSPSGDREGRAVLLVNLHRETAACGLKDSDAEAIKAAVERPIRAYTKIRVLTERASAADPDPYHLPIISLEVDATASNVSQYCAFVVQLSVYQWIESADDPRAWRSWMRWAAWKLALGNDRGDVSKFIGDQAEALAKTLASDWQRQNPN
jgi:hypothetical protein